MVLIDLLKPVLPQTFNLWEAEIAANLSKAKSYKGMHACTMHM